MKLKPKLALNVNISRLKHLKMVAEDFIIIPGVKNGQQETKSP